jgi:hypothetical protein
MEVVGTMGTGLTGPSRYFPSDTSSIPFAVRTLTLTMISIIVVIRDGYCNLFYRSLWRTLSRKKWVDEHDLGH